MVPVVARVCGRRRETRDTWTLAIDAGGLEFRPGQFNMLYAYGIGEIPVSVSGDPGTSGPLMHTVRAVGPVSEAVARLVPGDALGVRGPYGTAWPVAESQGSDVVVVAGGLGLAPLRPAIYRLIAERDRYGSVVVLYGTRSPADILFRRELERWRSRLDIEIEVTVDHADSLWRGHIGVVTNLIGRAAFDPDHTVALVCGPEIMMRFTAGALEAAGVAPERIFLSLERNMKCAVGQCGHCQFGPTLVAATEPSCATTGSTGSWPCGSCEMAATTRRKPKLAVWKFASCDGCQLSLLDCEDELLALAGKIDIAYFPEASRRMIAGPYDLSLVEGSITTPADAERILRVRRRSRRLVTIGACATAGGIQALATSPTSASLRPRSILIRNT